MPDPQLTEKMKKKISERIAQLEGKAKQLHTFFKDYVPADFVVPGLVKDYVDAVKQSKGVTVAMPSVTSTIQKAGGPNPKTSDLKAAITALEKHKAEVAKNKEADPKKVKEFQAALDVIAVKVKNYL